MVEFENTPQFETFRDCLSAAIVEHMTKSSTKAKRRTKKTRQAPSQSAPAANVSQTSNDAEDIADFTDYIATQTFESVPADLQSLTHAVWTTDPDLQTRYALPLTGAEVTTILPTLDPDVADSLTIYGIIDGVSRGVPELLAPVLTEYVTALTAPPPPPRATRNQAEGCELCGRDWIPLTYHHLIPRFVHDKAVRRGWHQAEDLDNVAWLCRLCHSFVHRFAGHEELARHYYTVELQLAEEDVVKFARYASRVRWKGR
ncbi:hypothetical protein ACHAQH_001401 [Verticillium albo-atrum]